MVIAELIARQINSSSCSSTYVYIDDKTEKQLIKLLFFFHLRHAASIELYEGKTQTNSTVWSSLNSTPLPLVERQTFIISGSVAALRETITEKGITNKHVLSEWNELIDDKMSRNNRLFYLISLQSGCIQGQWRRCLGHCWIRDDTQ